jgi:hypothetical protein
MAGMDVEMFQQAMWLSVYGAYIASRARASADAGRSPDQGAVTRWAHEAAIIANMVAVTNGAPTR